MAKGRMISKDASRDPDLNRLPIENQCVYLLTLAHLDRDGLISGEPALVWSDACPYRAELLDKMPAIIQSWVDARLVIRYDWKDGPILYYPGFRKHNSNLEYTKEPVSKYPPPPDFIRCENGLLPNDLDAAKNLASFFNPRNQYQQALLHHAVTGVESDFENTSRTLPEVVGQTSGLREGKRNISRTSNRTTYDDDEENVTRKPLEVLSKPENTSNDELLTYAVELAAEALPEWVGTLTFLTELNCDQFAAALSWIWLYSECIASKYDLQHEIHYCDQVNPFAEVDNVAGKIITQSRLANCAPLHSNMEKLLREGMLEVTEQVVASTPA